MRGFKSWIISGLLLFAILPVFAQQQFAYRISFTDKAGAPPLSNPLVFLSQRALDRRSAQNISLNQTDRPVSPLYVDTVLTITGGVLHVTSKWLNNCVVLLPDSSMLPTLASKPWIAEIRYVAFYQNGLHQRNENSETNPNPIKSFSKTTGNAAYYGAAWNQTQLVNGDCLHDAGFRGAGKLIAIMDDGYNYVLTNHGFDSLNMRNGVVDVHNFVGNSNDVYSGNSHGTQALSVMAGIVTDTFVGAAPDAAYALYVTEDQSSEQPIEMDNFVAALERADSVGADVINASIGYNIFFGPLAGASLSLADIDGKTTVAAKGVNIAATKGILCVISAGNEGGNSWNKILTPGDADSALTVGNVNAAGMIASNSGFGPNAAGVVKPDVLALGNPAMVLRTNTIPIGVSGTSFATPQIAGFAACLSEAFPLANESEIRLAIKQSASQFNNPGTQTGYGIPDFCAARAFLDIPPAFLMENGMALYPNPANDFLQIKLPENSHYAALQIIRMDGAVVFEKEISGNTNLVSVSVAALPAGVYGCKIWIENQMKMLRFVKL